MLAFKHAFCFSEKKSSRIIYHQSSFVGGFSDCRSGEAHAPHLGWPIFRAKPRCFRAPSPGSELYVTWRSGLIFARWSGQRWSVTGNGELASTRSIVHHWCMATRVCKESGRERANGKNRGAVPDIKVAFQCRSCRVDPLKLRSFGLSQA